MQSHSFPKQAAMIARRTVLLSGLALSVASYPLALVAQAPLGLHDFVVLSARVTGRVANTLDLGAAQALHEAFLAQGKAAGLAALLAASPQQAAESALGRELALAWYTGVFHTPQGPRMVAGAAPLVWSSAAFLHPPGSCGGLTGYWADGPAA